MRVYLSPHYDDVCFSIGGLAHRCGGELVNLFTVSSFVAAKMDLPKDKAARIQFISALRRAEDQQFAQAARLNAHDLGLPEPAVLGCRPFDLTNIDTEVAALLERLMPYLESKLPPDSRPQTASLYCPMAIGGHRNHVSTLMTIRSVYDELRTRCTVFLYEDLHYASGARVREVGMRRAAQLFDEAQLVQTILPLEPGAAQEKLDWIRYYASQHETAPSLADFTPASGIDGPHEIVWQIRPPPDGHV